MYYYYYYFMYNLTYSTGRAAIHTAYHPRIVVIYHDDRQCEKLEQTVPVSVYITCDIWMYVCFFLLKKKKINIRDACNILSRAPPFLKGDVSSFGETLFFLVCAVISVARNWSEIRIDNSIKLHTYNVKYLLFVLF